MSKTKDKVVEDLNSILKIKVETKELYEILKMYDITATIEREGVEFKYEGTVKLYYNDAMMIQEEELLTNYFEYKLTDEEREEIIKQTIKFEA